MMENNPEQREDGEVVRQPPLGAFTGLVSLQLADLIQMVCLSRWDLVVRVSSAQGMGIIQIHEGRIDHAQTDNLQGDAAFFEMFRWTDGQFEMLPCKAGEVHSIGKPWEHLLVEAMRQRDEAFSLDRGTGPDPLACAQLSDAPHPFGRVDPFDALGPGDAPPAVQGDSAASAEILPSTSKAGVLKVLVVEDSPFFARQLRRLLESDGDMEVIAIAKNGQEALDILAVSPHVDVVTLDVAMPVMPGGTALKHIMVRHRVPALVISAFQPNAMGQIFEYLELGAVDFISKPGTGDDIDGFGRQIRDLARSASGAQLSHFRRLRKGAAPLLSDKPIVVPPRGRPHILLVLGAEGAYVDWLRIHWSLLCQNHIVIGLQKLPHAFLDQFCRLVESRTGARTAAASHGCRATREVMHLANGGGLVSLKLNEVGEVEIAMGSDDEVPWHRAINPWLEQLAEQGRDRVSVLCLSAAHQLAPETVEHLIHCEARLILSPRQSMMFPELVEGIQPYAHLMPQQVVVSAPENLLEVLAIHE